ncbi:16S rRNA (adenine(1518)-N(6)/adenine(1519)-N(6))-dimethyltransferase RsmA [Mycoplasma sp. NEAQ87857]|uniref:16S rRNA (adenine(1518)-N(6)/adenine(1519)-N(6))- dimethyltransferase RsmA n=1 Tax=Mycoplasma sp. NEAQ87857 TaxID=2683967 RepID=UPI0013184AD9|nr:16S rRNA (adenine(1518)-N(6)/adenine(1519)-N(6))-dimethyltransferase RsmA [Mycoplasma sp. NEAQ87857]QGZ97438.1 16S rRNA (adenine(1518)-N(6)/adenine(1519)-N(6))-dimethyltransferase RsmA [Mycoplasma sp. NEAQ87857]
MKKNNKEVFAKKKYGQNFLSDKNIINKIIKVFDYKDQNVLEIGPGRGALTKELVKDAKQVIAYEIDIDMVNVLNNEIQTDNFQLINQDFLQSDLSNLDKSWVIANIPYYITTDILFKLFDNRTKFNGALLMVQKEVAQRICAKPNQKDYSKLSLSSQYLADCKLEFIVPAKCFNPAPKVDSAIISLVFKNQEETKDWDLLKDFFKICFENRRKQLINTLKNHFETQSILDSYQKMNLDNKIRIQQLSLDQVIELFWLLNNKNTLN